MSPLRLPITILLADDDEDDRQMTIEALKDNRLGNDIRTVADGEELMNYLQRKGQYADAATSPRPGLILLDLNMPKKDGLEALTEIKADSGLKQIPVIMLTTSKAEEDVSQSYHLGANSFITKPVTIAELAEKMKGLSHYWFEIVELSRRTTGNG